MVTTATLPAAPAGAGTAGRGHGPARRVVAASLLAGALLAGALPLVVFAGAREHVITGSALLGFAVGWTLFAALAPRVTGRSQQWALVPAAGLASTGVALMLLAPGEAALTAAGWVWPPVLLALAAWIGLRTRRALPPGHGRRLLYPVVAVMAAAAVGGMVETVVPVADPDRYAMPGRAHDVGGHRLHIDCTGSGSPTVVLSSGLGGMSASWARVAPALAGTTRVCAYDRAGQGWSDEASRPQDGLQAAADLHALLERAGEQGPYVLVGHSIGGNHAMTYADRYPEQVAGMVLLDATDPYRSSGSGSDVGRGPRVVAMLPSLARLGVGRLLPPSFWSSLPEPAAGRVAALSARAGAWRNVRDEYAAMPALLDQAGSLATLGSTPLLVLTAAGHDGDPAWASAQERMAALSSDSLHRHADAQHSALLDEERGAAASVRAVDDVVDAVRTGTPLRRS